MNLLDRTVAAQRSAQEQLPDEDWLGGIGNVVLSEVAVQPVGKVHELVVERDDKVRDQPWHVWQCPALDFFRLDLDHLLDLPLALRVFEEVPHAAAQCRAHIAVRAVRIVQKSHL